MRRNTSHFEKRPRPEQFDSDTDDGIQIQPDILTLDTDNHLKMKMCNQHNSHAEQDDQQNSLYMKFLLNFQVILSHHKGNCICFFKGVVQYS